MGRLKKKDRERSPMGRVSNKTAKLMERLRENAMKTNANGG